MLMKFIGKAPMLARTKSSGGNIVQLSLGQIFEAYPEDANSYLNNYPNDFMERTSESSALYEAEEARKKAEADAKALAEQEEANRLAREQAEADKLNTQPPAEPTLTPPSNGDGAVSNPDTATQTPDSQDGDGDDKADANTPDAEKVRTPEILEMIAFLETKDVHPQDNWKNSTIAKKAVEKGYEPKIAE